MLLLSVSCHALTQLHTPQLGLVLIAHAGYSAFDHLAYLRSIGKHESQLPSDILFEVALSLLLFIPGAVVISGTLKPISLKLELSKKTMDTVDATPGFKII
eukprot:jgi/Hompol1/5506/HPOL_001951-RA